MKKILFILLTSTFCIVALNSCELAKDTSDTAKEGAKDVVQQIDRSKVLGDLTSVTGAINAYGIQHDGAYPKNLDELKLDLYYPEDLVYDPKKGHVHSKTYPNL